MVEVETFKCSLGDTWTFVRVDKAAALALIKSLAAQMLDNSPNTGRAEHRCGDHEFFTIAVTE
jgi:hypothetical protein